MARPKLGKLILPCELMTRCQSISYHACSDSTASDACDLTITGDQPAGDLAHDGVNHLLVGRILFRLKIHANLPYVRRARITRNHGLCISLSYNSGGVACIAQTGLSSNALLIHE